ncbi:alkanesulfonate monooxygenase SsuD/methylene tetrahydromethanopterin reductase-like flavin-dependent oxidoreductase (luciferase family) [Stackebrandtia endophytica]|uniref:Alkanesulfonate monooxygenase SsuD/methylene tetrahydromethanopterin reductase-like flavin-dependent oxidoreductase (Luciferase family) n=1 Tax=Stackebrandtia endophytica TaxID=1496996 RepID=A0A543B2S1_9ACTN|nr:LLM class flavin-dependent oxidoreductase [Stackebrandtia endophytica]TQL79111.1 alkanesulfonate monooxygenase SsuD/methylene tetrahydromethanopterin reductase-like flavin-dependent oxidoreductase (luciferase family) [Stackebrandtia endophytica]
MQCDLFLVGEGVRSDPSAVPSNLLSHAVTAEAVGFDTVWLAEHHFIRYGACPSPPVMAASILSRTTRLRVGTAACVLSNRHPVALAEEAVMLDAISDGRFRLGVARGGPWVDVEVFGAGPERLESGFEETLDVLLSWLEGGEVGCSGRFFDFRSVPVLATPSIGLGVWVAATSRGTVDLAAHRGLPLLLGVHSTVEENAGLVRRWREVAEKHGHDPDAAEHGAVFLAYAADNRVEAIERLRIPLIEWLSKGVGDYRRLDGSRGSREQTEYVDRLLAGHLVGAPGESAERLAESAEVTGIRRALLMVEGAASPSEVDENIRRLGVELVPIVS